MKKIYFLIVPLLLLGLSFRPINTFTVSGTISDEKGKPIPSVTIAEKGAASAISSVSLSKNDGTYTINVANSNGVLVFTAVGYSSKEVKIKRKTVIDVKMSA